MPPARPRHKNPERRRTADAAGSARAGWLHVARALNQVDTDTMRHLSPTVGEAADLALCTGRLAYADPAWTLSSGPGHQPRPPQALAPHPGDIPLALAAAHHACDTVTSLACAERERIRTAASAGRLLVPTRSLPASMDIPRPFAPAPRPRVYALLCLYQDAAAAAAEASAQAGEAAAAIQAPSCVLTTARAAAYPGLDASAARQRVGPGPDIAGQPPEPAGAVQDLLHRLGITNPDLLGRAADVDRASEQLIIEAARQGSTRLEPPSPITPDRSAASLALTHGTRAHGDPHAAILPHDPASGHQHESPQAEAEL